MNVVMGIRQRLQLGPLRWSWRMWTPAVPRFRGFKANHFLATLEHQCAELREIEDIARRTSCDPNHQCVEGHSSYRFCHPDIMAAYAKEFADCISVAVNGLRWCTDGSEEAVVAALKKRSSRYSDPHAIIDKYIREHGA